MLNEAAQAPRSIVRQPLLRVLVNNQLLTGVIEAEVEQTGDYSADRFRVVAAVEGLPEALNLAYWADASNVNISIIGGAVDQNGNPQLASWLTGRVDDTDVDIVGRTLRLTGRDMSGVFFDTPLSGQYRDLTSSQIAAQLAANHGLQTAITATATRAGKIYHQYHTRLIARRNEWDLLTFLAEVEGFDCFVSGMTLYFGPPIAASAQPYVLLWSDEGQRNRVASFKTLQMRRALTLADDVIVKVQSWNQAQQKSFSTTLKSATVKKSDDPARVPQTYVYNVANLDQSQVNAYAAARMADISKHERVIDAELPGDNILIPRAPVQVAGTGTSFDQLYYPVTVTRHISVARGFCMTVHAKNCSPRNVTE